MKQLILCVLFVFLYSNHSFAKIYPEEIVETFQKNPELFNVLAQMSYNYIAQKNASEAPEEELLRKELSKMAAHRIPGTLITQKRHPETEKSVVAFVSPYCPHCRVLVKNLIQLEKEGFFRDHTAVSLSYAPNNLASECATKAIMAAHKLGGNQALAKSMDILETRINPVESSDWPKIFSQNHKAVKEEDFRDNMESKAIAQSSKECEQCVARLGVNSFPVIAVYSKKTKDAGRLKQGEKGSGQSVVEVILGNPSHINLLKETLLQKLK
jgi:hypothetical protein